MALSRTAKASILALGQLSAALASLVTAAVLSRVFDKADYATYRQTVLVYNLAAPLLALGLPQAVYYFVPRSEARARGIVLENLMLLGLLGLLCTLFLLAGGNRFVAAQFGNPDLEKLLLLFAPYPAMMAPTASLAACLVTFDRSPLVALHSIATRGAGVVLVVGAALVWGHPTAAVAALVVAGAVTFLPALVLMLRAPSEGKWRPTRSGMREQLAFSIPLGLASSLGLLTLNIDKVLVARAFPGEVFAVYVNGAMEIPLIAVITGSVSSVLLAEMSGLMSRGAWQEAIALWRRSAVKTAGILYPIFAGLMLLAPELMVLLYSEAYVDSARPFRIYLLALLIRVAFFGVIFQGAGRNRLVLRYTLLSLALNVVVSVILMRWIGPLGAAVGSIAVIVGFTAPYNCHLIRRHVVPERVRLMPFRELAPMLAACLVAMGAGFLAKWAVLRAGGGTWPAATAAGATYGILVAAVWWRFGFVEWGHFGGALRALFRR